MNHQQKLEVIIMLTVAAGVAFAMVWRFWPKRQDPVPVGRARDWSMGEIEGLPFESGFYWHRPKPNAPWRIVSVEKRGRHLVASDMSLGEFTNRPINDWFGPVGEWVHILEP